MVASPRLSTLRIGSPSLPLFDEWTRLWHLEPLDAASPMDPFPPTEPFPHLLQGLHRANFDLWHLEDQARAPRARADAIAEAKRRIDAVNQLRNDQIERCDAFLLAELGREDLPNPQAELHSETPGLMLDRLSILSLKRYHTLEEMARPGAPGGHLERNRERLAILTRQRSDLAGCLDRLWQQLLQGQRRFQIYRQLKMYNDPELNPVLYRANRGAKD